MSLCHPESHPHLFFLGLVKLLLHVSQLIFDAVLCSADLTGSVIVSSALVVQGVQPGFLAQCLNLRLKGSLLLLP